MTHCFTRTIAAALAGAILISAGAAGAQSAPPPAGAQTARISYLPGELASPAGLHRVMARIQRTAARACEADRTSERLYRHPPCQTELAASMVAQINDGRLTALWQGAQARIQLARNGR